MRTRSLYYVYGEPEDLATAVTTLATQLETNREEGTVLDYSFDEYAPHIAVVRIRIRAPSDFIPIRRDASTIGWFMRDENIKSVGIGNTARVREYERALFHYVPPNIPRGTSIAEAARMRNEAWAAAVNAAAAAGVTNTTGPHGAETARVAASGSIPAVGRYTERTAAYQADLADRMIGRWLGPAPKNLAASGAAVSGQMLGPEVARTARIARLRAAWATKEGHMAEAERRAPRRFPTILVSLIKSPAVAGIIGQANAILMDERIPEGRRVPQMREYVHSAISELNIPENDKPVVEESLVSTLTEDIARWSKQSKPFNYDPLRTPGARGGARRKTRRCRRHARKTRRHK